MTAISRIENEIENLENGVKNTKVHCAFKTNSFEHIKNQIKGLRRAIELIKTKGEHHE